MEEFGILFKKYRLRAEFASLSEFGDALMLKGYLYDISIISRWQKGKKIPTKRKVLVEVLKIFVERGAITSLEQANAFLESSGHGYLTYTEQVYTTSDFSSSNTLLTNLAQK